MAILNVHPIPIDARICVYVFVFVLFCLRFGGRARIEDRGSPCPWTSEEGARARELRLAKSNYAIGKVKLRNWQSQIMKRANICK